MNLCALCARPQPDAAYACATCAQRIGRQLHTIAELVPDARAVAARQTRRGAAVRGNSSEIPLPFDPKAQDKLDKVQNNLTTWARDIAYTRGQDVPAAADPLVAAAKWLGGQVEWVRHTDDAQRFAVDIATCERVLWGIVDRPGDRRWLGQCGADLEDGQRCEGDVYSRVGAVWARCRACGASFATDERRAWLDELARERSYTARVIGEAYDIPEGTIRTWAHRGEITSDGEDDGRPTYLLGPVLDLAASKHAAREERRARKAGAA